MSNVSGVGSNPLGFNSDQIITQLVNSQYGPRIDNLNSRVSEAEDAQSAYRDLNSSVDSLQSSVEELTNPETFQQKSASSGNSDVVSASIADADQASSGTDDIFVEQLATSSSVTSGQFINNRNLVDNGNVGNDGQAATAVSDFEQVAGSETLDPNSDTLQALSNEVQTSGGGMGSGGDGTNEVRVDFNNDNNWTEFDLDSYDSIGGFVDAVNSHADNDDGSGNQAVEFSYDQSTDQFKMVPQQANGSFQVDDIQGNLADGSKGFFQQVGIAENASIHTFDNSQSEMDIDDDGTAEGRNLLGIDPSATFDENNFSSALSSESGTIRVNNTEISYDASSDSEPSSINELVDAIDSEAAGVTASYDEATDKITLDSESTGQGDITVEDVSGNLANVLNLRADGDTSDDGTASGANQVYAEENLGQDARVNYNGTTIFESSNTFTRNGIEYQLEDTYEQASNTGEPVQVNVEQDAGSVADTVSDFVDDYNSTIETINSNSNVDAPESPDGEENDSGVFVGSSTAQTVKRQLNRIVSRLFEDATGSGSVNNSSNVGIELVDPLSGSQSERGKIEFDEGKFTEALENNSEEVTNLFAADAEDPDRGGNQDGIAVQLNNFAQSATGSEGFISSRIDGFDTRIENLNDRVERQQERAQNEQERLQERFLRLEQQMMQLQQQQSRIGNF